MKKQNAKAIISQKNRDQILALLIENKSIRKTAIALNTSIDILRHVVEFYNITKSEYKQSRISEIDSEHQRKKCANNKGKKAYTDGLTTIYLSENDPRSNQLSLGSAKKGKYYKFRNINTGEIKYLEEAPSQDWIKGNNDIENKALMLRTQASKRKNVEDFMLQNDVAHVIDLRRLYGNRWVFDKDFLEEIGMFKYKNSYYVPNSMIDKIATYDADHILDRHRVQRECIAKFERENNCTNLNTLISKFGQISFIYSLPVLQMEDKYKNLKFISNDYIPEIEKHVADTAFKPYSHIEDELADFLSQNYSGEIRRHVRDVLFNPSTNYHQELDIYIPEKQLAIEVNGVYWHSDQFSIDKNYHEYKSKRCEDLGIRLIHIYDDEWINSRHKIELLLLSALGQSQRRIYARNCQIREISNSEAKILNDAVHLQNHRNAQITYALFYQDELVQLMSFSNTRYNRNLHGDNDWEIIRGCPGSNHQVIGGVSKLFKHFIKNHNPERVFSYCDFNKFDGKSYEAIGMKFIGYTGPNMWWVINNTRIERNPAKHQELKKSAQGKLWGAGSKKYLWTNNNENNSNS